ncbi:MAG TPA: hypothetical protein VMI56_04295, partial [Reyranella sp.]|nr:hypothetical protein [Reyranella sp.]
MPFPVDRRRVLLGGAALSAVSTSAFAQREDAFEIAAAETATIDGREWDKTIVGGTTVDAVHRSVLLRFPKAADEIVRLLRAGRVLVRAELVLSFKSYEIVPEGYTVRDGLGRKRWTDDPPSWHIEAFPLRQPWKADRDAGPTFNASVSGKRYWAHYGAADPNHDRHAGLLEPQELSTYQHDARFDITRLLATPVVEREPGARLLWLESKGFLLRKLETYDSRYRDPGNAYEWAMPIAGHGLSFTNPRIVLACRRTTGIVSITTPIDLQAEWEMRGADGSRPSAVMPTAEEVATRARAATAVRGRARPDWQLQRLAELTRVG